MLLLAPAHAAKMSPAEYQEATQALQHGAEWVPGGGDHYFWRAHVAMATPPAAGESWYLHTGPGLLPADLLEQIMTPDGTPATQSPDSAQLLNYKQGQWRCDVARPCTRPPALPPRVRARAAKLQARRALEPRDFEARRRLGAVRVHRLCAGPWLSQRASSFV